MLRLTDLHSHNGGVAWRLTPDGVEVQGTGVERTAGPPETVMVIWERFSEPINRASADFGVYCELILATICTESGGDPDACRPEPQFVSDAETPDRISVGVMQTPIATARDALHLPSIDRAWLCVAANSIAAGTGYIAVQRPMTDLDPPKVACAYNSGGIYDDAAAANRWRMRQLPLGTGTRCDRFVRWFNDAAAMLKTHPIAPHFSLRQFLATL